MLFKIEKNDKSGSMKFKKFYQKALLREWKYNPRRERIPHNWCDDMELSQAGPEKREKRNKKQKKGKKNIIKIKKIIRDYIFIIYM